MKKLFIASFDMEVGGVERSLISMLNNFNYKNFNVDLFLHSHTGEFFKLLPKQVNILDEVKENKTLRQSIKEIFKSKYFLIGVARLIAKLKSSLSNVEEAGYIQTQYIWKYCLPFFPKIKNEYDVAISYLWPHDFVANNVNAKCKIAWIHTDYSAIQTEINMDLAIWEKFDRIVSISEECSKAFLNKYPSLTSKVMLVENITAPGFIKNMSLENIDSDLFDKVHFNLLSIGRLCTPKAFDRAIEVLKLLHSKGYNNIRWYVIGYGPDEALLKKLITQHQLEESFILLGKKENPYPYLKACDLYIQPSLYEGKAVTVSEAQILAKPILVTNYATSASQISHNIDGIICGQSIDEIASAIISLYEDESKRLKLSQCCQQQDYSNSDELNKLYNVMN